MKHRYEVKAKVATKDGGDPFETTMSVKADTPMIAAFNAAGRLQRMEGIRKSDAVTVTMKVKFKGEP